MSPAHLQISKERKVTVTIGALLMMVGTIVGGVGATVTFKANAENKDAEHDRSIADHETRIRFVETSISDRMGRIETKVDEILRRKP